MHSGALVELIPTPILVRELAPASGQQLPLAQQCFGSPVATGVTGGDVRRRPLSPGTIRSRRAQRLGQVLECCVLGGLLALWAGAARADQALKVAIPAQALAGALAEFAHQTGLQVIYVARLARSRNSKGARAGQDPAEALPALLEGTGLSFEFLNERTVRIFETPNSTEVAPPPGAKKSNQPSSPRAARFGTPQEEITVVGSLGGNEAKIDEDVQNTAGSVSMVGGERLEAQKLEQLSDYAAYLPSLNLDDGGVPSLYIVQLRGISSLTEASTVGYYIDDVPTGLTGAIGIGAAPELIPYDLERLEVRRGPQGTLGGAGSEIGEIRYVLNEPSVSGFEARVGTDVSTTEYASRPGTSLQGMVNVPMVRTHSRCASVVTTSTTRGTSTTSIPGQRRQCAAPLRRTCYHAVASD